MTPADLAKDLDSSLAFLRDVVGYGALAGEDDPEDLRHLDEDQRKLVLAWHWPHGGYPLDFDPRVELEKVRGDRTVEELHRLLRAQVGSRALSFIATVAVATRRSIDDVLGAACWLSTCSGESLLGVFEGRRGLALEQICRFAGALGLRFVDPREGSADFYPWTGVMSEVRARVIDAVLGGFDATIALAEASLARRIVAANAHDAPARSELLSGYEGLLPGIVSGVTSASVSQLVNRAKAAFSGGSVTSLGQICELALVLAHGSDYEGLEHDRRLLEALLTEQDPGSRHLLVEHVAHAANLVRALPLDESVPEQGHGWLILDRGAVGVRIGEALTALESVTAARSAVRMRFGATEGERNPEPGSAYIAPAPGTRYRPLYEALATEDELPSSLPVDPEEQRIYTPTRGWLALPPSAVRDRAWWSGSDRSAAGRPQVKAWLAAGFNSPNLELDDRDRVIAARFTPLPGRAQWITIEPERRLTQGRFVVPPLDNTPLHALLSYPERSIWAMDENEVEGLTVRMTVAGGRGAVADPGSDSPTSSEMGDDDRVEALVALLRQNGELSRPEIEALMGQAESSTAAMELEGWLPRVLAKASRQQRISNIGSRKQPRWVETHSAAHLAALLTRILEKDRSGERVRRLAPPRLGPGEPVPWELCKDVITHVFGAPNASSATTGGALFATEGGEVFLTDEGMRAVLDGRRLTQSGVRALLSTIHLREWAAWEAEAAAAGALETSPALSELDEAQLLED